MKLLSMWVSYRDSIKTKLIVNVILIHAILMGLVVFDLLERERGFMEKQLSQKGYNITSILSTSVTVPLLNNDLVALNELLTGADGLSDVYMMFILDKRLKVKASTNKEYFAKTLYDDISLKMRKNLNASKKNSFQSIHGDLIDTLQKVNIKGKTIGYVRTIINRKALLEELTIITNKGLIYILLAILLGGLFAWLTVRTMTKNLEIVAKAADDIANKNFEITLDNPTNNDEIAKMIKAFKTMRNSIHRYIDELEQSNKMIHHEKELAEVTLSSIGDCVIVTDQYGNVKFINPAASRILKYSNEEAVGKQIEQLFKKYNESGQNRLKSSIYKAIELEKTVWEDFGALLQNKYGEEFYIENSASPIKNIEGEIEGAILVFYDVTERKKIERDTKWSATHDSLTKLSNRTAFDIVLENLLKRVRIDQSSHTFLFMDLDKFKTINDSVGHLVGDQVLREIAQLLKENVRNNDFLFRFGGDEFGVILFDCEINEAKNIAQNFIDKVLEYKFQIEGKTFNLGLSIGISQISMDCADFKTILSSADFACYLAKDEGRNRYHIATEEDSKHLAKELGINWIVEIDNALKDNRFILFLQKIKDLSGNNDHYEILLRLIDKNGNMIYPDTFLPHAERYFLMPKIDIYVIKTFFVWLQRHEHKIPNHLSFSINITGQSISEEKFVTDILILADKYKIDCRRIIFEITETTAVANIQESKVFFGKLIEKGFRFSLDDFGTGLSSFEYLKNMAIDFLKIDGIFIKDILNDEIDRSMVESIYNIGSIMNLKIIAEYAESDEIIKELEKIGIHYAQGYAVEKPHPLDDILLS